MNKLLPRAVFALLLPVAVLAASWGCGRAAAVDAVAVGLPQAIVSCAAIPADLQARLWVSGLSDPCFLDVDLEAGTTSGSCTTPPGIERRLTLDWFVDRGGVEVVLAQAQTEVDLRGIEDPDVAVDFADDDVVTTDCLDMSVDSFEGAPTVRFQGEDRPVCDLDNDGVDNLAALCDGLDPTGG